MRRAQHIVHLRCCHPCLLFLGCSYDERNGEPFTDFYSIVPLWDMNQSTGATAVVPGSHKHVKYINKMRQNMWQYDDTKQKGTPEWWKSRRWVGPCDKPGDFHQPFTSIGLVPSVTNIQAGDMVIFDTALYHSGCPAEDPTGVTGHGPEHLLRAIFIMVSTALPYGKQSCIESCLKINHL